MPCPLLLQYQAASNHARLESCWVLPPWTWAILSVPITCISSCNQWMRGSFLLTGRSQWSVLRYMEENETEYSRWGQPEVKYICIKGLKSHHYSLGLHPFIQSHSSLQQSTAISQYKHRVRYWYFGSFSVTTSHLFAIHLSSVWIIFLDWGLGEFLL